MVGSKGRFEMSFVTRALSIAAFLLGAHAVHAGPLMRQLSDAELRKHVIGHEITDGAHWADRYLSDGKAEGHSLGKAYAGTWRIEESELCLTKQARHPRTECFEVWLSGARVEYRRGVATLAAGSLRKAGGPSPSR